MNKTWSRMRETGVFRYGVAIVAVAAALGLRLILAEFTELDSPFLLFFAAVMLASVYGGLGPGLVSATLSAIACDFFFVGPPYAMGVSDAAERSQITSFFIEGIMLSLMGALLRRERQRAEAADAAARRLEQRILEISEEERRRIGHDLHDGLGQHLTGIALLSKALQQRLAGLKLPKEAQQADQIAEFVNDSIGWTRDLARGLSPTTIQADGLPAALEELAANASKLLSVNCRCALVGDSLIDPETSLHMYRIAQEAINNAVKHGKAKNVIIELARENSKVRMTIRDDGSGLSEKTRRQPGLGLQIMQYRAKMIGGSLSVGEVADQSGTAVTCVVPASNSLKPVNQHEQPEHETSVGQSESASGG